MVYRGDDMSHMLKLALDSVDKDSLGQGIVRLIKDSIKSETQSERIVPIEGYTVPEVAQSFNVSEQYVWELIWSGQLESFKVGEGSRLVRVSHSAVRKFRVTREIRETQVQKEKADAEAKAKDSAPFGEANYLYTDDDNKEDANG